MKPLRARDGNGSSHEVLIDFTVCNSVPTCTLKLAGTPYGHCDKIDESRPKNCSIHVYIRITVWNEVAITWLYYSTYLLFVRVDLFY